LQWLLRLEEYGVIFEYLPEKENVVADGLSRLDIDNLKIQEEIEEALTLFSGSKTAAPIISSQESHCKPWSSKNSQKIKG
jgi:hypothetical protein